MTEACRSPTTVLSERSRRGAEHERDVVTAEAEAVRDRDPSASLTGHTTHVVEDTVGVGIVHVGGRGQEPGAKGLDARLGLVEHRADERHEGLLVTLAAGNAVGCKTWIRTS